MENKMEAWVSPAQAGQELKNAVKSSWFYVLVGLGISSLFFYLHSRHIGGSTVSVAFEHLGMGFLVSSIAVFFYEWGSHVKHAVKLSQELSNIIHDDIAKVAQAVGRDAIEQGCKLVGRKVQGKLESECLDSCKEIISVIAHLSEEGWAGRQCIGFISGLLQTVVSENVQHFQALVDTKLGEQPFVVPKTAATIADAVLAAQMNGMTEGDTYEVISDLYSWKDDQLPKFKVSTLSAVERGVHVRRLFNLLLEEDHPQNKLEEDVVRRILELHLEVMRICQNYSGTYRVKILGEDQLAKIKGADRLRLRGRLRIAHGGVFRSRQLGSEEFVRFKVIDPELSKMELCRDLSAIQEDLHLFQDVWKPEVPDLSEANLDDMVQTVLKHAKAGAS